MKSASRSLPPGICPRTGAKGIMYVKSCSRSSFWNSVVNRRKSAPVGAACFFPLAAIALGFLLLHFVLPWRGVWAGFYICAYFLFAPAIACGLYSLFFEKPKLLATIGLGLATITVVTMPESRLLLDLVISLPFLLLGVMVVVKFIKWRQHKTHMHQAQLSG